MNLWSEFYLAQGRMPELLADAPFGSKDIDFCGSHEAARLFAARVLRGRAEPATLDDATPSVGVVLFVDDGGHERVVAFLGTPFGMVGREVEQRSVRLDVLDEARTQPGRPLTSGGAASDVGRPLVPGSNVASRERAHRAGWSATAG